MNNLNGENRAGGSVSIYLKGHNYKAIEACGDFDICDRIASRSEKINHMAEFYFKYRNVYKNKSR